MLSVERMLNTKLEFRSRSRKSGLGPVSKHLSGDESPCEGPVLALLRRQAPGFAGGGGPHGQMGSISDSL